MTEKSNTPASPSDAEIESLGHRMAWRYKFSSDPAHSHTYTFNGMCLLDFARAIIALFGAQPAAPVAAEPGRVLYGDEPIDDQSFTPIIRAAAPVPQTGEPSSQQQVALVVAMDEGAREPRIVSWNPLPRGETWLYRAAAAPASVPGAPVAGEGYEHQRAIMEAERNDGLERWIRGNGELSTMRHRAYEAGFSSGWYRHAMLPAAPVPQAGTPASHIPADAKKIGDDTYAWSSAPASQPAEFTYSSTQATQCAVCGERKHTPLRVDGMGGYVCLTCIDARLEELLDATTQQPAGSTGEGAEPVAPNALRELAAQTSEAIADIACIWPDVYAEAGKLAKLDEKVREIVSAAPVAEAHPDAVRLDWLEKHASHITAVHDIGGRVVGFEWDCEDAEPPTVREAIDAALQATKEGGK
jgi:hypothetical protein